MSDGIFMKYFVLNPWKEDEYGAASRAAIKEFARIIENENPKLCFDLKNWVIDIQAEINAKEIIKK